MPSGVSLLCAAALVFQNHILLSAAIFTLCSAHAMRIAHTSILNFVIILTLLLHHQQQQQESVYEVFVTVLFSTVVPGLAHATVVACRGSFTVAEAAAVTAAVCTALCNSARDAILLLTPTIIAEEEEMMMIMDGLIRAGLAGCAVIWTCCILPAAWRSHSCTDSGKHGSIKTSLSMFVSVIVMTYLYVAFFILSSSSSSLSSSSLGNTTTTEPITWIFNYLFTVPKHRIHTILLITFWALLLLVMLVICPPNKLFYLFTNTTTNNNNTIIKRKFYHFIALLIFLPPLSSTSLFIHSLLNLCILPALALLLLVELLRVSSSSSSIMRKTIDKFTHSVIDERDQGCIIVTHLFLLLGCAVPSIMCKYKQSAVVVGVAGVVAVCVQDSFAAIVGSRFGSIPFGRRNRSLQGSLAGLASALVVVFGWWWIFESSSLAAQQSNRLFPVHLTVSASATMLMEAFTDQVDNWVVPSTFCTVLAAPLFSSH